MSGWRTETRASMWRVRRLLWDLGNALAGWVAKEIIKNGGGQFG